MPIRAPRLPEGSPPAGACSSKTAPEATIRNPGGVAGFPAGPVGAGRPWRVQADAPVFPGESLAIRLDWQ